MIEKKRTRKQNIKNNKANTRKKTKKTARKTNRDNYMLTGVGAIFVSVILAVFIYLKSNGSLGAVICNILFGLFSSVTYLLPFIILGLGIYAIKRESTKRFWIKSALCLTLVILLGSLIQLFSSSKAPEISALWQNGIVSSGGGLFGGLFAAFMYAMVGKIAGCIIIIAAMFVVLSVLLKVSFISMITSFYKGVSTEIDSIEKVDVSDKGRIVKKRISKKEIASGNEEDMAEKEERTDNNEYGEEDVLIPGIEESFSPQEEFDPQSFLEEVAAQLPQTEGVKEIMEEAKKEEAQKNPKRAEATTKEEQEEIKNEIEEAIQEKKEYVYPDINLLNKPGVITMDKRKEMLETSTKLMETLKNFGVEAKLIQVTNGPAVTRYEIQPNIGIKLSKITGLAEDIALNLAVPTVLVAPVPGKAAVGIEVPNNSIGLVTARELLQSNEFKNSKSKLTIALGKDIGGKVVIGDISKFPHVLIAGSTGSGKSVCINTIITSLLYKSSPEEVKIIMIDPKVVELGVYNGIPHLLIPVVTDPKRAAGALNWAVGEMMRRYSLFAQTGMRNLEGYNKHIEKEGGEKIPKIVIIIDELADLMMVAAKEVEDYICRLAQLARAAGIHLIIATQRPSVDVITGLIKANVPSRIAFAVSSGVDSRTILDRVGAEKLLGKGDMLYHPTGNAQAVRVQGAFLNDEEVERVVEFVKQNAEDTNYSKDLEDHIERISTGENGVTEHDDADDADSLLPQAIELALELGQISTAMVQRKMKVGYARAGRIIDQMESRGLIGGANGSKPREVYTSRIKACMMADEYRDEEND